MFEVYGFDEAQRHCPSCVNAKRLLQVRGKEYTFKPVHEAQHMQELKSKMGVERMTLPQIWHDGEYVGGFAELRKYVA